MQSDITLVDKTTRSLVWNFLYFGLDKILVFISIAILARLVSKEDFGLMALASVAVNYLSTLNGFGLGAAIINRQDNVEEAANTVFSINIVIGLFLSFVSIILAPWIANFFDEPLITNLIKVLGISFVIISIGSIHHSRLEKELDFKRKTIVKIAGAIIKGGMSIGFAYLGYGVWSLVYGQLAGVAATSIGVWIIYPWRPIFRVDRNIAKELIAYGSSIVAAHTLSVFEDNIDYLIIGKVFDTAILGVYSLAYRLPEMLVLNLLWVITGVVFPAYSKIQSQPERLKGSVLATIKYLEIIVVPICLGLVIAAEPITLVFFGEKWLEAVPVMRILSIYALVISIGFNFGDAYKAIGRPDIIYKISIPVIIIRVIGLWLGAQYGLISVALAHLFTGIISLFVEIVVASRLINIGYLEIFKQLKAFLGGIVLILFAFPVLMLTSNLHPIIWLISIIISGVVGYGGAMYFIERDALQQISQVLLRNIKRNY